MFKHYQKLQGQARAKAEKMVGRTVMSGYRVSSVGSRTIPFMTIHGLRGSDWDFLVDSRGMEWELQKNGFDKDSGSEVPESQFTSMSYEHDGQRVNFILAHTPQFYDEFMAAQTLCCEYKVKDKTDRIHVFETIRKGDPLDMEKLPSTAEPVPVPF